ncbi:MAG: hypothetical protein HY300_16060 [Verrucomicrobia bacterium]|nr:hypothetical protein [Verrucomicrobiota bacterium]
MKFPFAFFVLILLGACQSTRDPGGVFYLRWIEKPVSNGPAAQTDPADQTRFHHAFSFDRSSGSAAFALASSQLREGDVIAYRLGKLEADSRIITGRLNSVGYRLLRYGHLAIVVHDSQSSDKLRLFSSESFGGPNLHEGVDSLKAHDWDCYRLEHWERVNTSRLYEFIRLAMEKAGNWRGYDFIGMFGLWNSNLHPDRPSEISTKYICSTTVLAALYYAGVELDAVHRGGVADLVTPLQVVNSPGRFIQAPSVSFETEVIPSR